MLKNKKGFTLVELLAVIVILAIILAIAVPTISTLITNQKKAAFASSVKMMIKSIDYQILQGSTAYDSAEPGNPVIISDVTTLGANNTDYSNVLVTSKNPITISVSSSGNGIFPAEMCAVDATFASVNVTTCVG